MRNKMADPSHFKTIALREKDRRKEIQLHCVLSVSLLPKKIRTAFCPAPKDLAVQNSPSFASVSANLLTLFLIFKPSVKLSEI